MGSASDLRRFRATFNQVIEYHNKSIPIHIHRLQFCVVKYDWVTSEYTVLGEWVVVEHLSVKITVRWCWRAPPGVYFKIDADTPPILVFDRRYQLLCVLLHSWDVSKFSSQLLYLLGGKTIEWNARLKVTEPGMLANISGSSICAWKWLLSVIPTFKCVWVLGVGVYVGGIMCYHLDHLLLQDPPYPYSHDKLSFNYL